MSHFFLFFPLYKNRLKILKGRWVLLKSTFISSPFFGDSLQHFQFQEEDKSLYFTPDGSPHKDVANVDLTSPLHGGAKRKSHKRMVSNLSNFFPFWWGMGQSDHCGVTTGTTVAVIESDTSRHEDEGLGEESVTLVINTEDKSSTSSIYVKS